MTTGTPPTSEIFTAAVTLTPAEPEHFDLAFTAVTQPCPWPKAYGGDLVAQAAAAAMRSVTDGKSLHSMHSYFLRPADIGASVHYEVEVLRGEARASFVMDHGRFGPPGVLGGGDGAPNVVRVHRGGEVFIPEHLSKDQDIPLRPGDRVEVMTPGGGGYGNPFARDAALVARDVGRGYYTPAQARALFGVVVTADNAVDAAATASCRKSGGPT